MKEKVGSYVRGEGCVCRVIPYDFMPVSSSWEVLALCIESFQ